MLNKIAWMLGAVATTALLVIGTVTAVVHASDWFDFAAAPWLLIIGGTGLIVLSLTKGRVFPGRSSGKSPW